MFLLVPIAITDPKKESRDLLATVSYGILHTVCTLASIIISRCWYLVGIYILELFVVLIILLKSIRRKSKRFQELLTSVFDACSYPNTMLAGIVQKYRQAKST